MSAKMRRQLSLYSAFLFMLVLLATPVLAQDIPTGGTVTIAMWEDRENFNPYMEGGQTFQSYTAPVLERLISFDAAGTPIPVLTTEIPTVENGLVSEDGTDITFNLRPDVYWADGEPMTC